MASLRNLKILELNCIEYLRAIQFKKKLQQEWGVPDKPFKFVKTLYECVRA